MPCEKIGNAILCYSNQYIYIHNDIEYYFEWHRWCGPAPLMKDGELRKSIPKGFWNMVEVFQKFTEKERLKYLV